MSFVTIVKGCVNSLGSPIGSGLQPWVESLAAAPLFLPPARKPMTLANAAYLGIQRYANNRVNENWTTGSSDD